VRDAVGLLDTTAFARYEIHGPGARAWLDRLLACKLPSPGRIRLAPMLSPSGRLMGDLTILCWREDRYWLMGSYYLQRWHMRWFRHHLPASGVALRNISDEVTGFALAGPRSREVLAALTSADLSGKALPFMSCRKMEIGLCNAHIGRLSVAGELGYEINVRASEQLALRQMLLEAGRDQGLAEIGYNALNSLRMEKSFGIWSREFTWAYTPGMCGLDRFTAFDKGDFIGREAALKERDKPSQRRLVTLEIAAEDADASGFEPVWMGERRIGFVTSGAYGHSTGKSLAMAYLDRDAGAPGSAVEVHVIGVKRRATVLPGPAHDPAGARMRG